MSDLDFSHVPKDKLEEMLNQPALKPPAGVEPNFENPGNENAVSLVTLILCFVMSSTFLAIRIYVRFFKMKQKHIVDYLIIVAYAFYIVVLLGSLRRIAAASGLFVHEWNIRGKDMSAYLHVLHILNTVEDLADNQQTIFIGDCCWVATMLLVKASILLEWLRIFAPANTRDLFFWGCRIMLALNVTFYCSILIALNLTCFPYARIWDKTLSGTCIDIKVINLVAVVINCVLDIAILILPQKVIWKLHISRRKRIGVSTVFAMGITYAVAHLPGSQSDEKNADMRNHYSGVALWAIAESTCGILVFSVPVAPKAFRDFKLPKLFFSLQSWAISSSKDKFRGRQKSEEGLWPHPHIGVPKSGEYESIEEPSTIHLRNMESGRPTDRQYGIICTTDITVTESYEPNATMNRSGQQYPWCGGT